MTMFVVSILW
jgi:hypothetical protein